MASDVVPPSPAPPPSREKMVGRGGGERGGRRAPAGRGGCGKRWRGVFGPPKLEFTITFPPCRIVRISAIARAAWGKEWPGCADGRRFSRRSQISKRATRNRRQRRGSPAAKYAKTAEFHVATVTFRENGGPPGSRHGDHREVVRGGKSRFGMVPNVVLRLSGDRARCLGARVARFRGWTQI